MDNEIKFYGAPEILPARSDQATADAMDELKALTDVMQALSGIQNDAARRRILAAAAAFFKVHLASSHEPQTSSSLTQARPLQSGPSSFSETKSVTPKEFLMEKSPRTDVERVACLAYFLTHYRETPHFKTIDISKLNTEAAQPKFGNAAKAVDNAANSHYLVPAAKGNKQISAMGERFVQALPDRDTARNAMAQRPRKKRRLAAGKSTLEERGEAE